MYFVLLYFKSYSFGYICIIIHISDWEPGFHKSPSFPLNLPSFHCAVSTTDIYLLTLSHQTLHIHSLWHVLCYVLAVQPTVCVRSRLLSSFNRATSWACRLWNAGHAWKYWKQQIRHCCHTRNPQNAIISAKLLYREFQKYKNREIVRCKNREIEKFENIEIEK